MSYRRFDPRSCPKSASSDLPTFAPQATAAAKEKGSGGEARSPKEHPMLDNIVRQRALQRQIPRNGASQGQVTFAGTVEMAPVDWAEVPPNDRQRDTVKHAQRAVHLKVPHPTHAKVNMARLPDGSHVKLDGHTRAYLWKNGSVEPPTTVYVDVWSVPSRQAAGELYSTFDSRAALETSTDQVFGGLAALELAFTSDLLKSNCFTAAMRFAYEMLHGHVRAEQTAIYALLQYWQGELKQLDACDPKRWRFNTGVTIAALLTFRRYGAAAASFWQAYSDGTGSKLDGQLDPIQALEERMTRYRMKKRMVGASNIKEIARVAISAYERWRAGDYYDQKSGRIIALSGDSFDRWLKKTASVVVRPDGV